MDKVTLDVPQETVDYLQRLSYEIAAKQDVIARYLVVNSDDVTALDSAVFRAYSTGLAELTAEYEEAKRAYMQTLPDWTRERECTWSIDFARKKCTITGDLDGVDVV